MPIFLILLIPTHRFFIFNYDLNYYSICATFFLIVVIAALIVKLPSLDIKMTISKWISLFRYLKDNPLLLGLPIAAFFPPLTYFEMWMNFNPGDHPNSESAAIFDSLDYWTKYYINLQQSTRQLDYLKMQHRHIAAHLKWYSHRLPPYLHQELTNLFTRDYTEQDLQMLSNVYGRTWQTLTRLYNEIAVFPRWVGNGAWHEPFPDVRHELHWHIQHLAPRPEPKNIYEKAWYWVDEHGIWVFENPWSTVAIITGVCILSYFVYGYLMPVKIDKVEPPYEPTDVLEIFEKFKKCYNFDRYDTQSNIFLKTKWYELDYWHEVVWYKWYLPRAEYIFEQVLSNYSAKLEWFAEQYAIYYTDLIIWLVENIYFYISIYYQIIVLFFFFTYTAIFIKRKLGFYALPVLSNAKTRFDFLCAFLPWWFYGIGIVLVLYFTSYLYFNYPYLLDPTQPYYTINNDLSWSETIDSHAQNIDLYQQYIEGRFRYFTFSKNLRPNHRPTFVPADWPLVGRSYVYRVLGPNLNLTNRSRREVVDGGVKYIGRFYDNGRTPWIFQKWEQKQPRVVRYATYTIPEDAHTKGDQAKANIEKQLTTYRTQQTGGAETKPKNIKKLVYEDVSKEIIKETKYPSLPILYNTPFTAVYYFYQGRYFQFLLDWYTYWQELKSYFYKSHQITINREHRLEQLEQRFSHKGEEVGGLLYGQKYKGYAKFIASDNYWHRKGAAKTPRLNHEVTRIYTVSHYPVRKNGQIMDPYWYEVTRVKITKIPQKLKWWHYDVADEFIVTRDPYKIFDLSGYARLPTWTQDTKYNLKRTGIYLIQQCNKTEWSEVHDPKYPWAKLQPNFFMKLPPRSETRILWIDKLIHYLTKINLIEDLDEPREITEKRDKRAKKSKKLASQIFKASKLHGPVKVFNKSTDKLATIYTYPQTPEEVKAALLPPQLSPMLSEDQLRLLDKEKAKVLKNIMLKQKHPLIYDGRPVIKFTETNNWKRGGKIPELSNEEKILCEERKLASQLKKNATFFKKQFVVTKQREQAQQLMDAGGDEMPPKKKEILQKILTVVHAPEKGKVTRTDKKYVIERFDYFPKIIKRRSDLFNNPIAAKLVHQWDYMTHKQTINLRKAVPKYEGKTPPFNKYYKAAELKIRDKLIDQALEAKKNENTWEALFQDVVDESLNNLEYQAKLVKKLVVQEAINAKIEIIETFKKEIPIIIPMDENNPNLEVEITNDISLPPTPPEAFAENIELSRKLILKKIKIPSETIYQNMQMLKQLAKIVDEYYPFWSFEITEENDIKGQQLMKLINLKKEHNNLLDQINRLRFKELTLLEEQKLTLKNLKKKYDPWVPTIISDRGQFMQDLINRGDAPEIISFANFRYQRPAYTFTQGFPITMYSYGYSLFNNIYHIDKYAYLFQQPSVKQIFYQDQVTNVSIDLHSAKDWIKRMENPESMSYTELLYYKALTRPIIKPQGHNEPWRIWFIIAYGLPLWCSFYYHFVFEESTDWSRHHFLAKIDQEKEKSYIKKKLKLTRFY